MVISDPCEGGEDENEGKCVSSVLSEIAPHLLLVISVVTTVSMATSGTGDMSCKCSAAYKTIFVVVYL